MIKQEQVGLVLQKLYNNEIDIRLTYNWDAGFDLFLIKSENLSTHRQWQDTLLMGVEVLCSVDGETGTQISEGYFATKDWEFYCNDRKIEIVISKLCDYIIKEHPDYGFSTWYKENIL